MKTIQEHRDDIFNSPCKSYREGAAYINSSKYHAVVNELAEARHKIQTLEMEVEHYKNKQCKCIIGPEWSGSLNPDNPDHEWICDDCNRIINME